MDTEIFVLNAAFFLLNGYYSSANLVSLSKGVDFFWGEGTCHPQYLKCETWGLLSDNSTTNWCRKGTKHAPFQKYPPKCWNKTYTLVSEHEKVDIISPFHLFLSDSVSNNTCSATEKMWNTRFSSYIHTFVQVKAGLMWTPCLSLCAHFS